MGSQNMPYVDRRYGIVVTHQDGSQRLFASIHRVPAGDIYVNWTEDRRPENVAGDADAHASYHASGQLHTRAYQQQPAIVRQVLPPTRVFRGNQPIIATNADRALHGEFPRLAGHFDDVFEIPSALIAIGARQVIAVDAVEPNVPPANITGRDDVLARRDFTDDVPWIVVRLIQPTP
jgi:hypothetical protein